MKRSIFKKSAVDILRYAIAPVIFTLVMMGLIMYGLRQAEESSRAEALRILDSSIRRAVVMCYAIEGQYPESIAYIEEHYQVSINWDKYIVHYSIFASNLMPDIMVIEL